MSAPTQAEAQPKIGTAQVPIARRRLRILGTRGIPAVHGGFETFAERLALFLKERGWLVTVYCQVDGKGEMKCDQWGGIERVHIPVSISGPISTVVFDWKSTLHAARAGELCLTLGYNTAVFNSVLKLSNTPSLINMDGIEWQRKKWGPVARLWFRLNEWAACWVSDHLIADHPAIALHLNRRAAARKITMIPYGADRLQAVSKAPVLALSLDPQRYVSLIARPEPENSVLEIVQGFSQKHRGVLLAVLGNYTPGTPYHDAVKAAAGPEVRFLGAIYDKEVVQALRVHSLAYLHGHQVGGTNPSLVEALGAGNAVLAHDNPFNRWVAGAGAAYFVGARTLSEQLDRLLGDKAEIERLRDRAICRFEESFTWTGVLDQYERLLQRWLPTSTTVSAGR